MRPHVPVPYLDVSLARQLIQLSHPDRHLHGSPHANEGTRKLIGLLRVASTLGDVANGSPI